MAMHDIHLYLRYANSCVLFSDWRNVVTLHTANPNLKHGGVTYNRER